MFGKKLIKIIEIFFNNSIKIYLSNEYYDTSGFNNDYKSFIKYNLEKINFIIKNKLTSDFVFIYENKVIKVFLHKKYFVRYLYNYENFTNYNKITIKKGIKNDTYYIEMTFVKSTRIFSSKDINFNYNFKIIKDFKENYKTIHYITIPNYKMENLYQFFKYFLVFYRQISIGRNKKLNLKLFKEILNFLEKHKEIFILERNLYFIHGDFTSDNLIVNNKIYSIDYGNSGWFDFYYDLIGYKIKDLKDIFNSNGFIFNEIRYEFNKMLYNLID